MSEMVNKVAKAIADAAGSDFDRLPATHGPGHGLRNMYLRMARAAIEAMRQPTEAMIDHAHAVTMPDSDNMQCPSFYRAMVDAALKDGE